MMVSASEDSGSVMNLEVPEKSHFIVLVLRYILAFIRTCSQKSRTRSYSRGDLTRFEKGVYFTVGQRIGFRQVAQILDGCCDGSWR